MSRAFVREAAGDEAFEDLPDRPVSQEPNLVTPEGFAWIEAEFARWHEDYARAQISQDRADLAQSGRELRYWNARRSNAELIPVPASHDEVRFGATVTIQRDDGRSQSWRIVGEDEAEPAKGTLPYVAPLARALMGKRVGDVLRTGTGEVEIVAIA